MGSRVGQPVLADPGQDLPARRGRPGPPRGRARRSRRSPPAARSASRRRWRPVATWVVSWLITTWAPRSLSLPKTSGFTNTRTGASGRERAVRGGGHGGDVVVLPGLRVAAPRPARARDVGHLDEQRPLPVRAARGGPARTAAGDQARVAPGESPATASSDRGVRTTLSRLDQPQRGALARRRRRRRSGTVAAVGTKATAGLEPGRRLVEPVVAVGRAGRCRARRPGRARPAAPRSSGAASST